MASPDLQAPGQVAMTDSAWPRIAHMPGSRSGRNSQLGSPRPPFPLAPAGRLSQGPRLTQGRWATAPHTRRGQGPAPAATGQLFCPTVGSWTPWAGQLAPPAGVAFLRCPALRERPTAPLAELAVRPRPTQAGAPSSPAARAGDRLGARPAGPLGARRPSLWSSACPPLWVRRAPGS